MAEFNVGKLLPNVTVSLETENTTSDSIDIVNQDDQMQSSKIEIVRPSVESLQNPKIYVNKNGGFATGIDLIAQEKSGILKTRAERFGLGTKENRPSISNLYRSMGIDIGNRDSVEMKQIILNALHVRGVENLNTSEVLAYFQNYGPEYVEWINDCSCNVNWLDEASCARALLNLSTILPESFSVTDLTESAKKTEVSDDPSLNLNDNKESETMEVEDTLSHKFPQSVDIPIPPGHWRLGVAHSKAKNILLRFARKGDKKLPGAEKRSKYYQIHGNPNYGGLKGIISSSRKHKAQVEANRRAVQMGSTSSYNSFSSHQSDTPPPKIKTVEKRKYKMYADEEEELKAKKLRSNSYLKETHGSVHSRLNKKSSVHSRLGVKLAKDGSCIAGKEQDYESNYPLSYYDLDYPRPYRDLDDPRSYKDLDDPRESRVSSYTRNYELGRYKARKSRDLRSKLKGRNNLEQYGENYSRRYDEEKNYNNATTEKLGRADEVKKDSSRKHRSPLCKDEEYQDDEEENDSNSDY